MKILMVASEASPFVKTGGLADVLGSLPAALVKLGDEVTVVLPRYRTAVVTRAQRIWTGMALWVGPRGFTVSLSQVVRQGVQYLFVECPPLYDRAELYGDYADNHIRFALLNQAAIEIARNIFRPDIFHAHDWQAGMLPAYLRTNFGRDPTFFGVRCLFTIHNLGYQGTFPGRALADLGVDPSIFHPEGLEFWGYVNLMKAGIVWSDAVTTVSPTYAHEIQTPEFGFGLDGLLRTRAAKLHGILNGVDYEEWNPQTDRHLAAPYSADDLSGKRISKKALLLEMGILNGEAALQRPLIGIVSRFVAQKGFDLVAGIAGWLPRKDVGLAVIGSGEAHFERMFRQMAAANPDRFCVRVGFDNRLAHRIEAGADMFLMPSQYEPCGLNQIYSLRYGTVPIVRATGGLEDTVDEETGFKFREYTPEALAGAIDRALSAFADRESWIQRVQRGMGKDFSWSASAREYQRLYRTL
jgi:starch synthase